jgi:hypothetical protein
LNLKDKKRTSSYFDKKKREKRERSSEKTNGAQLSHRRTHMSYYLEKDVDAFPKPPQKVVFDVCTPLNWSPTVTSSNTRVILSGKGC